MTLKDISEMKTEIQQKQKELAAMRLEIIRCYYSLLRGVMKESGINQVLDGSNVIFDVNETQLQNMSIR